MMMVIECDIIASSDERNEGVLCVNVRDDNQVAFSKCFDIEDCAESPRRFIEFGIDCANKTLILYQEERMRRLLKDAKGFFG